MLETGIPQQLLTWPFKTLHRLLTPCWIASVWEFVDHFRFTLHDNIPPVPLLCSQDQFIIPALLDLNLQPVILRQANICRLWLRVWRLSDITAGDGLNILPQYWNGTQPSDATAEFDWPRSARPSTTAWRSWQIALANLAHGPTHRLHTPLLSWTTLPTHGHTWFYSEIERRLFQVTSTELKIYLPTNQRTNRRPRFAYHHSTQEILPATAHRTTIYSCGNLQVQHSGIRPTTIAPPQSASHWALERLSVPSQYGPLIASIRSSHAFGLCDGSYKLHHGTAAFSLQDGPSKVGRILGCNRTPGHPDDQSSFRSELGGILGLAILLRQLCTDHHIMHGGIEIAFDCLSALKTVFEHEWDEPQQSCYDLIHQIRREVQASPLQWTWRHVKGHQDKNTHFAALDWRSQLNIEMDGLAKSYWNATYVNHETFYYHDPQAWSITHGTRQFSSLDRKLLYELCHGPPLQAYWRRRYDLTEVAISSINWDVCDDGLRRLNMFKRIWLAKTMTNTAPTGQILFRRGHQTHPNCPRCGLFEDSDHVIRCRHPAALALWHHGLISLTAWMTRQSTSPALARLIHQTLLTWHANNQAIVPLPIPQLPPSLSACFISQDAIGWNRFLYGFISTHWIEVQQAYYDHLQSRRTGFRWACSLFSELIQLPWTMWRHRCQLQQEPHSLSTQDEHLRLNALIQAEYDRGTLGWRHRDRRWMQRPAAALFEETVQYKQTWLHSVSTTRERHIRRNLTPHAQEQRIMHQFLHPPLP